MKDLAWQNLQPVEENLKEEEKEDGTTLWIRESQQTHKEQCLLFYQNQQAI